MTFKILTAVLLAMFCGTVSAQNVVDIYIQAGQSNADGRGDSNAIPSAFVPAANAEIWYNNPGNTNNVNAFQPLGAVGFSDPPNNSNFATNTFGPELSFAGAIQTATGSTNDIGIVKVTDGGTGLSNTNDPWNPNTPGSHYTALFTQVDAALADIAASGDIGVVRGFIWHQGESDRNNNNYTNLFGELVDDVRSAYGSNLPVAVGELSRDRTDNTIFNNNLATFANSDPNIALVSSAGLGTIAADDTHFETFAQLELGERYAAAIAPLVTIAVPEPSSLGLLAFAAMFMTRRQRKQ